ncbi:unnamed protein product [Prunus brigantina]
MNCLLVNVTHKNGKDMHKHNKNSESAKIIPNKSKEIKKRTNNEDVSTTKLVINNSVPKPRVHILFD